MSSKPLFFDNRAVGVDLGRHQDPEPGVSCGTRNRQTVQTEIPVLRYQIENTELFSHTDIETGAKSRITNTP